MAKNCNEFASNGVFNVHISYNSTPKAHMSDLKPYDLPSTISGLN